MGFLKRLLSSIAPSADEGTTQIPHHFFLVVGGLRIPAEFFETRNRGDDFFSNGYVMTGPRGGQYGLFDDGVLVPWEKAGLILSNVAGVTHYGDALQRLEFLPSKEVTLEPQPDNRYDPNAVAVWDLGKKRQLGYLSRDLAATKSFAGHRAYVFRQYRDRRTEAVQGLKLVIGPALTLDIPDD
jgi:hypothetical protein